MPENTRACVVCGAVFPVHKRERNRKRFCGDACRVSLHRHKRGRHTQAHAMPRPCVTCGATFTPATSRSVACSDECGRAWRYEPAPPHNCPDCGVQVDGKNGPHCYCPECSIEHARERGRRSNRRRRVLLVGGYSLRQIAERDGCSCHLCGLKVNMALSGMHPMGPTIDHLIPLSAGGIDDPVNVALAHRSCNVKRGVGGEVQLRLIA